MGRRFGYCILVPVLCLLLLLGLGLALVQLLMVAFLKMMPGKARALGNRLCARIFAFYEPMGHYNKYYERGCEPSGHLVIQKSQSRTEDAGRVSSRN